MADKLYYVAPSDEIFMDIKRVAEIMYKKIGYESTYINEKLTNLNRINNISDNFMYILASFDNNRIVEFADYVTDETKQAIRERLISVNNPLSVHFK